MNSDIRLVALRIAPSVHDIIAGRIAVLGGIPVVCSSQSTLEVSTWCMTNLRPHQHSEDNVAIVVLSHIYPLDY